MGLGNDFFLSDKSMDTKDDLDNIQKIFELAIKGYITAEDHTKAESICRSGYYDKHLDKDLRPQKIVYCPGLTSGLGEIADSYYKKHKAKFGAPSVCDGTDFNLIRGALLHDDHRIVKGEQEIVEDYAKKVPAHVLPIVSALAFETPSWETRYLEWTSDQNATIDAALRINLNIPQPGDVGTCMGRGTVKKRTETARLKYQLHIVGNSYHRRYAGPRLKEMKMADLRFTMSAPLSTAKFATIHLQSSCKM